MQKNLFGLVIIAAALIFTACGDDSGTSSGGSGYNASKNTLADSRDGQTYKTVVIGNQIWMAENLNYNAEGSLCYDDDKSNCKKYGRLYPWLAAIDTTKAEIVSTLDGPDFVVKNPHQGVCPKGWHIPSVGEFKTLINYVGKNTDVLRSVSGWTKKGSDEEWPGTDEYGFNLLPAGEHRNCDGNVGFGGLGYNTSMWDDQTDMTGNENSFYVDSKEGFSLEEIGECETSALSIRCLKDDADDDVFNSDSVEINESSSTSNSAQSSSITDPSSPEAVYDIVCYDGTVVADASLCPIVEDSATVDPEDVVKGEMTDLRDGQIYKIVTIGTQTWMAQNLNYAYNEKTSSLDSSSFCYNNSADSCSKYGRLYLWSAAMDSTAVFSEGGKGCGYGVSCSAGETVRGVCPEGWHLPSDAEWDTLFTAVGYSTSGFVLKSTSGWSSKGGNGDDSYGFAVLPAGCYYEGHFRDAGDFAYFWSSAGYYSDLVHYWGISGDEASNGGSNARFTGFAVRCIQDSD